MTNSTKSVNLISSASKRNRLSYFTIDIIVLVVINVPRFFHHKNT